LHNSRQAEREVPNRGDLHFSVPLPIQSPCDKIFAISAVLPQPSNMH